MLIKKIAWVFRMMKISHQSEVGVCIHIRPHTLPLTVYIFSLWEESRHFIIRDFAFPSLSRFFLFQVIRTRHEKRRERENSVQHTMREGRFYHFMRARRGLDDLVQVVLHAYFERSKCERKKGWGRLSLEIYMQHRFWRIYLSFEGGKAITLKCLVRKPTKGLKWKRTKCVQ